MSIRFYKRLSVQAVSVVISLSDSEKALKILRDHVTSSAIDSPHFCSQTLAVMGAIHASLQHCSVEDIVGLKDFFKDIAASQHFNFSEVLMMFTAIYHAVDVLSSDNPFKHTVHQDLMASFQGKVMSRLQEDQNEPNTNNLLLFLAGRLSPEYPYSEAQFRFIIKTINFILDTVRDKNLLATFKTHLHEVCFGYLQKAETAEVALFVRGIPGEITGCSLNQALTSGLTMNFLLKFPERFKAVEPLNLSEIRTFIMQKMVSDISFENGVNLKRVYDVLDGHSPDTVQNRGEFLKVLLVKFPEDILKLDCLPLLERQKKADPTFTPMSLVASYERSLFTVYLIRASASLLALYPNQDGLKLFLQESLILHTRYLVANGSISDDIDAKKPVKNNTAVDSSGVSDSRVIQRLIDKIGTITAFHGFFSYVFDTLQSLISKQPLESRDSFNRSLMVQLFGMSGNKKANKAVREMCFTLFDQYVKSTLKEESRATFFIQCLSKVSSNETFNRLRTSVYPHLTDEDFFACFTHSDSRQLDMLAKKYCELVMVDQAIALFDAHKSTLLLSTFEMYSAFIQHMPCPAQEKVRVGVTVFNTAFQRGFNTNAIGSGFRSFYNSLLESGQKQQFLDGISVTCQWRELIARSLPAQVAYNPDA